MIKKCEHRWGAWFVMLKPPRTESARIAKPRLAAVEPARVAKPRVALPDDENEGGAFLARECSQCNALERGELGETEPIAHPEPWDGNPNIPPVR